LLMVPGATLETLRRVISHPVALAQCGDYLGALTDVDVMAVYDTAGAAREVAETGTVDLAAVASANAAERYGLTALASDIQDRDDNQTRFFALRRPTGTEGPPAITRGTGIAGRQLC